MLDLWRILNAIDYIQKRPWEIEGGSKSCCSGGAGLQVLLIKKQVFAKFGREIYYFAHNYVED